MYLTPTKITAALLGILLIAAGCQPISRTNPPTGSVTGTAIGAGAGVIAATALKSNAQGIWAGGILGASLGYYMTTLQFDASGITRVGGQVFELGKLTTINIPTDQLFDSNTADFLPDTSPILDSVVSVLKRSPDNNLMISGNMSGFGSQHFEQKLSEERAQQVANYLWAHGVSTFRGFSLDPKRMIYVGYGNFFPIANSIRLKGIRQNSRIQITSFPTASQLHADGCLRVFNNIGAMDPEHCYQNQTVDITNAFSGDTRMNADTSVAKQVSDQPQNYNSDYSNIAGAFKDN